MTTKTRQAIVKYFLDGEYLMENAGAPSGTVLCKIEGDLDIREMIVNAVNSHEELVTACKLALERWGKMPGTAEIGSGEIGKVGDALKQAVAKAEGL